MKYDLAIVGCGSVGAAAGYYAATSGVKVLMLDSHIPPHLHGSHHGDTRLIRHAYGEGEKYVPLVLRAQELWEKLEEISGVQLFHRSGVLSIGPATSEFMSNVENSAIQYQLNIEKMDAGQLQSRWPEWSLPNDYIGILESNAGYLKSELAVRVLNEKAAEAGAEQHFNCRVNAIIQEQDGIKISTAEGEFSAHRVAVTAGTWAKILLPELPMTPVRKVFSWYQADGRYSENNKFPGFTVETPNGDLFYGFPFNSDGLKLGKHNGGQPISAPEQRHPFGSNPQDSSEVLDFLRRFLPGVGVCLHGEACTYDVSPDEDFIIDSLPNTPQVSVVTGLSGHGFKFATVLGEIIALQAAGQPIPYDLSAFKLNRF